LDDAISLLTTTQTADLLFTFDLFLGTTLVVVPTAVAQSIHSQIPGAIYDDALGWLIPNTPEVAALGGIQFVLNGVKFDVIMKDIMRERVHDKRGYVYSGIASNDRVVSESWLSIYSSGWTKRPSTLRLTHNSYST
jgi:hypothetical protein